MQQQGAGAQQDSGREVTQGWAYREAENRSGDSLFEGRLLVPILPAAVSLAPGSPPLLQ